MSIDEHRFVAPADGRRRPAGSPFRVLSVGRLVPEKGSPILLEAIAELVRRGLDVELAVIGDGPLRAGLEQRIEEPDLAGRVRLVGAVGQDVIAAHYQWADAFALPSFQEGLPVVLMEAMATGLPVVATRIAAVEELVQDGMTGHVVAPGRADMLASALADLAGDPARRLSWGEQGRRDVLAEFTAATTAPAMQQALRAVPFR